MQLRSTISIGSAAMTFSSALRRQPQPPARHGSQFVGEHYYYWVLVPLLCRSSKHLSLLQL